MGGPQYNYMPPTIMSLLNYWDRQNGTPNFGNPHVCHLKANTYQQLKQSPLYVAVAVALYTVSVDVYIVIPIYSYILCIAYSAP